MIYFVRADGLGLVKIGVAQNVERRLHALQAASPVRLSLLASFAGGIDEERDLHLALHASHSHREWFFATAEVLAAADVGTIAVSDARLASLAEGGVETLICYGCGVNFPRVFKPGERIPPRPFHSKACMYARGGPRSGNRMVDAARHVAVAA